ncbi:LysR family transcriptional regulator [Dongia deserti]|uniref:LysR family transcriptional regulator n=1 Tax=Dongia deserti TaxID=2268030 RepID=UPI000E650891|nr:LysR family transcriptional regulator [Dongia deserti]
MDIQLAQTFLDIVNTGSFVRAAKRLHVSQTTVSARIRLLESQLGRPLFVRNKAGASLTAAGEQFLRYAQVLVQVWRRACQQVAIPTGRQALLTIGGELSLWNPLLLNWLVRMKRSAPEIALRTEVSVPNELMRQVAAGVLDIAVMYQPQQLPGLRIEEILTETLVCVTTSGKRKLDESDYVYVDWGPSFSTRHNLKFPELANPGLFVDLGPLGLNYILRCGGSGYFRSRTVTPYLRSGQLRLVPGAPKFAYPVHVLYSASGDSTLLEPALRALRKVADSESDEWPIDMPVTGGTAMAAMTDRAASRPSGTRNPKEPVRRKRQAGG